MLAYPHDAPTGFVVMRFFWIQCCQFSAKLLALVASSSFAVAQLSVAGWWDNAPQSNTIEFRLMEQYIWPIVTLLLGLFTGSFLKSYLGKKGENLATHEDIQKLVDQMTAVTQATKEIEAKISDDVWNRQRLLELQREAVSSLMLALSKADAAVLDLSSALKEQKNSQTPDRFAEEINTKWRECSRALNDLDTKHGVALLVCSDKFTDVVWALRKDLRNIGIQLGKGSLNAYDNQSKMLGLKFAAALVLARSELGTRPNVGA